jgi:hypothetical protein
MWRRPPPPSFSSGHHFFLPPLCVRLAFGLRLNRRLIRRITRSVRHERPRFGFSAPSCAAPSFLTQHRTVCHRLDMEVHVGSVLFCRMAKQLRFCF